MARRSAAGFPPRDPATVRSEFHIAPALLNGFLTVVLKFEAILLARARLPFGVTALLRASKPLD